MNIATETKVEISVKILTVRLIFMTPNKARLLDVEPLDPGLHS